MAQYQVGDRLLCTGVYGRWGEFDDKRCWFTLGQTYRVLEVGETAALVMGDDGELAVASESCFQPVDR